MAGEMPARGCSAFRAATPRQSCKHPNNQGGPLAVEITMKELLEAGVHFGHQTRRWNPKMKEYIFGERNGIHIIDLQKTLKMFREASRFVSELASQGRVILFVGTKRQAQEAISEEGAALRHVFRQSPMAGRNADQLGHAAEIHQAAEDAQGHDRGWTHGAAIEKGSRQAGARVEAPATELGRRGEYDHAAGRHVRGRFAYRGDCGA